MAPPLIRIHQRTHTSPPRSGLQVPGGSGPDAGVPTFVGRQLYDTSLTSEEFVALPATFLASNPGQYTILVSNPSPLERSVLFSLQVGRARRPRLAGGGAPSATHAQPPFPAGCSLPALTPSSSTLPHPTLHPTGPDAAAVHDAGG
jgi:hypothetical protein